MFENPRRLAAGQHAVCTSVDPADQRLFTQIDSVSKDDFLSSLASSFLSLVSVFLSRFCPALTHGVMAEDSLLSAEQKFALIETVRGHPMLYDKKDDDYHNVERKNRVWANIAAKEGVQLECRFHLKKTRKRSRTWTDILNLLAGKEAKESWDRLRTLFKRNHNKKAASGSGAAKTPKWQFYTAMEFLESHSEPRAE